MTYRNTWRGFTLIEFLVVVLLVAILAAVALPYYQKAVKHSHAVEGLSYIKSLAQAYENYYLTNGTYASKFDDLDVVLPLKGNTKFLSDNISTDTRSNNEWSLQIEKHPTATTIFAAQIRGKYKGAGFVVVYDIMAPYKSWATKTIYCFERKGASLIVFDSQLPNGAYCEKLLHATYMDQSPYMRIYSLP